MGNFGPNMNMERSMTSQQVAAMQQMRNNYMSNQNGPFGGNNQNNQMNSNANAMSNAAAMQRYQQMQSSRQQIISQIRSSPNMMGSNMKSSNMNYPPTQQANMTPTQANFNQNRAHQAAQIAQMQSSGNSNAASGSGGAKWHTPQQKQASNHGNNVLNVMGMSMSPPATTFINDSFILTLSTS